MLTIKDLPTEIYHEIISQFQIVLPPPPTRSAHGKGRAERSGILRAHKYVEDFSTRPRTTPDLTCLRILRLVSQKFNEAATRALFRSTTVIWQPELPKADLESWLLSGATVLSSIRKFALTFRAIDYGCAGLERQQVFMLKDLGATRQATEKIGQVLENLHGLESLSIIVGRSWKNAPKTMNWDAESGTVRVVDTTIPQPDTYLTSLIMSKISKQFKSQKFETLNTLCLSLPCTYNFIELEQHTSDSLWSQLKVLFLEVLDATGPGGSTHNDRSLERGYRDEDSSSSNLQQKYPNNDHQHGIFNIVTRCRNLHTLGIGATHILDGNLLEWKPASNGLKSLYLRRINISASNLITLLSPADGISIAHSRLEKLWLDYVDLTSGTWSDIFSTHLMECPKQWYLNPHDLGYAIDGDSSHYRDGDLRDTRYGRYLSCLWSVRASDKSDLKRLVKRRVRDVGGRDSYPYLEFEQHMLED